MNERSELFDGAHESRDAAGARRSRGVPTRCGPRRSPLSLTAALLSAGWFAPRAAEAADELASAQAAASAEPESAAQAPPAEAAPLGAAPAEAAPALVLDDRAPEDVLPATAKRALPSYDGRGPADSPGGALVWVPRVVLFPLYLVSEYALRRPLGWLVSTAEREHWPTIIFDFLTFNERQGGIIPTFMIDFGMRPSVGVYAFWNDFVSVGNDLRLRAAYGGRDLHLVTLADRFGVGDARVSVRGVLDARPDNVFEGIGNDAGDEQRSRYYRRTTSASVQAQIPWFLSSRAELELRARHVELNGNRRPCCGDPAVDDLIGSGDVLPPPGIDQDFGVIDQRVDVVLDSRAPRFPPTDELASDYSPGPGTGVRLDLRARVNALTGQSLARAEPLAESWAHYGASLGGHLDLTGHQRNLGATIIVDFVDPIGDGVVPLSDLVSLGGSRPLRGFLAGQFVDRSSAVLRLEYHWPIAVWLDGSLNYEVGQVYGPRLSGLELAEMRSSYSFGMQAVGSNDHPFQLLVALGTKSFEDGAGIDGFRFVLGTTAGF